MFVRETERGPLVVTSASDLTAASSCEFAFLRRVDAKLGRDVTVPPDDDPMLARAGQLGEVHEARELERRIARLGEGVAGEPGGVVSIPRPASMDIPAIAEVAAVTLAALEGRADVVFQATFFDPEQRLASAPAPGPAPAGHDASAGHDAFSRHDAPPIAFLGFADFLELRSDGSYEVQDTKLARTARVTALMQLAAYAEQLERLGVPVAAEAVLILGSGERSAHRIADIAPVFRRRRERLHEILLERFAARGPDGRRESAPSVAWGAPGVVACGRCEVCGPEVERTRDVLLVAGVQRRHRDALLGAGIGTIDALAAALPEIAARRLGVPGVSAGALERLAVQADAQLEAERSGATGGAPPVRVIDPAVLGAIPPPDPGDLFFDFEGDPFYQETGDDGIVRWNLDYLFGAVDVHERFMPVWAHSLAEERLALERFLATVAERRRRFPAMRIYHYAAYERTHLLSIAARHGACEAEVDRLLRENVLVDLYPIVRKALRIGTRSYSIKKLEPLYMGAELRDADGVTTGAQSVVEYAEASEQLRSDDPAERVEGRRRLEAIADYNRYDCVSTLRLRDWLLSIAAEHGVEPFPLAHGAPEGLARPIALSAVGASLASLAETAEDEADRRAAALAGSAIDYYEREHKAFWWEHYARLENPIEDWADTRDVLVVDAASSGVLVGWHLPERARVLRRRLRLRGEIAPGSTLKPGSEGFALYDYPAPFRVAGAHPGSRVAKKVALVEVHDDGVTVEETHAADADAYEALPVALVPGPPPNPGRQPGAIERWGARLAEALAAGADFADPVYDILRRRPPRLSSGALVSPNSDAARAAARGDDDARTIGAVVASLRLLDRSTLAVQGPPGTGKTYLGARVIKRLVEEDGWCIGVVAQSHRVVENMLESVVEAGLAPALVGKAQQRGRDDRGAAPPGYTVLRGGEQGRFLDGHRRADRGAVVGGTAWDFAHDERVAPKSLDLLVIDEAGQFSLAPTIAAAASAQRLLLLGDQQQLPQVSQGSHPEPVDTSALEWLLDGRDTMPEELGTFLADTRRMHPALAAAVSELSYEGRLRAHPSTLEREVASGGAPGLHWVPVEHAGNATSSPEEAAAIVRTVQRLLDGREGASMNGRRLSERDIIVVAAYNAQVECIAGALAVAEYGGIRVGTVDRFQGQEAVFALVSLAASSLEDVPRGLEFLLMRNRLNVAISRAQWATYLFSSPHLGDGLPSTAAGLAALSGYLRLTEPTQAGSVEA